MHAGVLNLRLRSSHSQFSILTVISTSYTNVVNENVFLSSIVSHTQGRAKEGFGRRCVKDD